MAAHLLKAPRRRRGTMALACASSALAYVIPHFAAPPRVSPSSHRGGRKVELLEAAELLPLAGALAVAAPLLLLAGERRAAEGPLPPTVLYQAGTTAEGAELMAALTASTFPAAWREAVAALDGRATRAAAEGSGSLQGRIAAVQALEGQRHALADLLAIAVERQLSEVLRLWPRRVGVDGQRTRVRLSCRRSSRCCRRPPPLRPPPGCRRTRAASSG